MTKTHDQTRYINETNTIGFTEEATNVDDILETKTISVPLIHKTPEVKIEFHAIFEKIHPFLDSNGHAGRLMNA